MVIDFIDGKISVEIVKDTQNFSLFICMKKVAYRRQPVFENQESMHTKMYVLFQLFLMPILIPKIAEENTR